MATPLRNRSPSPQGRSFLSRLKSPFGAKARTPEFYIQLDEPHRQYSPGDIVSGSVILKVTKAIRITHLVVKLHAYVQVYKAPNNPGEGYKTYSQALAQGKTRKGGGYYGNGVAALFEDEVVLCGDGRLEEGTYQFNHELEMPRTPLPSSIDFERGAINYLVSATLTKPTTIAPTLSCEAPLQFQERIDIAKLQKPKPRIISLEPIKRRGRSRRQVPTLSSVADEALQRDSGELGDASQASQYTTSPTNSDTEPPLSPTPSRRSLDSTRSSAGVISLVDSNSISGRTGESQSNSISGRTGESKSNSSRNMLHSPQKMRSITAKIELQQAGYLRGDNGYVYISVTHTPTGAPRKPGKSVHGAIITLYRQARVDYQPGLTRVNIGRSEEADASPRRQNGSVGLSVSQGTKSHLFRKDLSQTFASLVVNPSTLKAEIRAAVRIPEHVFPTISNVPGAMISFRYYIEVALDLQNKLAGLDKFLPNAGMSGVSTQAAAGDGVSGASQSSFAWGGHCIDTEEIRRDKSVVSCVFEVVIGTMDSERKSRWKQMAGPSDAASQSGEDQRDDAASSMSTATDNIPTYDEHVASTSGPGAANSHRRDRNQKMPVLEEPPAAVDPPPRHAFPMPHFTAEEQGLSEKERMRRAEARLLPSQPPGDNAEEAGASSAPLGLHESDLPYDNDITPSASYVPTAPTMDHFMHSTNGYRGQYRFSDSEEAGPSAPAYEDVHHTAPDATSTLGSAADRALPPTEDKQELQRRHLEAGRSEPPGDASHLPTHLNAVDAPAPATASAPSMLNGDLNSSSSNEHAPSAPTMEELSLGFSPHGIEGDTSLPRYER